MSDPERIIPPPTDEEFDTATGGPATRAGGRGKVGQAIVSDATLARVDEALRWHEQRRRERQQSS